MPKISYRESDFKNCFPDNGFKVTHDLVEEDLLHYHQLASLSERLSPKSIEHNAADVGVNQDPTTVKKSTCTARDAIENSETANTWVVLKNVENDPIYKELMMDTVTDIVRDAQIKLRGIKEFEAFVFISSPNSVTPFHIDPEHNFLLQIRGTKTVHQWRRDDIETLPPAVVEEFVFEDKHRNLEYRDEFAARQTTYLLNPGEGLHFPVRAPHWVQNGPQSSVSFSITFRSNRSEREFRLHRQNGALRTRGKNPYPVNQNPTVDIARDTWHRAAKKLHLPQQ